MLKLILVTADEGYIELIDDNPDGGNPETIGEIIFSPKRDEVIPERKAAAFPPAVMMFVKAKNETIREKIKDGIIGCLQENRRTLKIHPECIDGNSIRIRKINGFDEFSEQPNQVEIATECEKPREIMETIQSWFFDHSEIERGRGIDVARTVVVEV